METSLKGRKACIYVQGRLTIDFRNSERKCLVQTGNFVLRTIQFINLITLHLLSYCVCVCVTSTWNSGESLEFMTNRNFSIKQA